MLTQYNQQRNGLDITSAQLARGALSLVQHPPRLVFAVIACPIADEFRLGSVEGLIRMTLVPQIDAVRRWLP